MIDRPSAEDAALSTAVVVIDQQALVENYSALAARAAPGETAATVKANGYGLGIEQVAPPLWDAGCRTFFVATPQEGIALRQLLSTPTIYILDGLLPRTRDTYLAHDLTPCLGSLAEARAWSDSGRPAALHIDTGMCRLGLSPKAFEELLGDAALRDALDVTLLMSHFACADDISDAMTVRQLARFDAMLAAARAHFPSARGSLANSAGTIDAAVARYDLARPGIALYGAEAINDLANPMTPAAQLFARVLAIRDDWAEDTVGYGAAYALGDVSRVATLGIGYADGLSRHLSVTTGEAGARNGGGEVAVGDTRAPIIGRISMDLTTIDVSHLGEDAIAVGDWVEIFGETVAVDEQARAAGTIGYELLTGLGPRVERRLRGGT
ncbi:MAG: alanine racemase [Pseudomonadota bacterium]